MPKVKTILDLIGNTPMLKLSRVVSGGDAEVWAKLEGFNPGGSVKDRPALAMVLDAEKKGGLKKGMKIKADVPALGKNIEMEVFNIAPLGDFATWKATSESKAG